MPTTSRLGVIIVSTVVVVGFFAVLGLILVKPIQFDERVAQILNILLGNLSALFATVVNYHVGSSAGSKNKDDIIAAQAAAAKKEGA